MKRRSLVAVLCILSMLAFAGFGKKAEEVSKVEKTAQEGEEVVTEEENEEVAEKEEEVEKETLDSLDEVPDDMLQTFYTAYKGVRDIAPGTDFLFNEDVKIVKAFLQESTSGPEERVVYIIAKGHLGKNTEDTYYCVYSIYAWKLLEEGFTCDSLAEQERGIWHHLSLEQAEEEVKSGGREIIGEKDYE